MGGCGGDRNPVHEAVVTLRYAPDSYHYVPDSYPMLVLGSIL